MSSNLENSDNKIKSGNPTKITNQTDRYLKSTGILMTLLPLAACGGGGGGGGGGGPVVPLPPAEFIEDPVGVFIALDDRDTALDQADATDALTVTGKEGDDTIHTGAGVDIIAGAGGDDVIRAGGGADTVSGGSGDDAIVLIGVTGDTEYTGAAITSAGGGYNLSDLITLAQLNGQAVSDVEAGEVIDGGTGTNTLFIYGAVDLTGVTLSNVTVLEVHSDVTLTPEQIALFTTVDGDGNSVINIEIPPGSSDTYILDLSVLDVADIASINIDGDITVVINDESDIAGIDAITSGGGDTLTVKIDGDVAVDLGNLGDTFPDIDILEISEDATVTVDTPSDITDLGLGEITGTGNIDSGGNSAVDDALDLITVDPDVNTIPHVVDESAATTENAPVTVDVLANDSDAENETLTVTATSVVGDDGTATIVSGDVKFTPGSDFNYLNDGDEIDVEVNYTVSDGNDSSEGTLTVTVSGENDNASISGTVTGNVTEDHATTTANGTIAANDADDGEDKFIAQTNIAGTYGTFSIDQNGNWTFTINNSLSAVQQLGNGDTAQEIFNVKSFDESDNQDITITIHGVNDAPDVTNDSGATTENATLTVDVLDNDEDAENDTLTLTATSVAAGSGSVSIVDGEVKFDPGSDFDYLSAGQEVDVEISYSVSDGTQSSEGTLTVTVTGENDAASISGTVTGDVTEDHATTTATGTVAANDADSAEDKFIAQADTAGNYGSFSIDENGEWIFTLDNSNASVEQLADGATLEDTFNVKSFDESDNQDITITIHGGNDAPNVTNDEAETDENTAITVDVLSNDSDPENDDLSLVGVSVGTGSGTVSIVDGEVKFDPGTDFDHLSGGQSEDVEITYLVSDGTDSSEGTLTVTVNGEIEHVFFSDGSKLTALSLSSNSITRGDDGVELNFAVDGDPVTITVEVTDTFGNDHLYSVTGTNGTMLLPMDGTERQKASSSNSNIGQYDITAIYIEDADGGITYLNSDNFLAYGFDSEIDVNSGSSGTPDSSPPELSAFDLTSSAITLGDDQAPQLLTITKAGGSSEIDGVLVKFTDEDGVLHSNYINASSGTFSLYFDPLTSPSGTYTLHSVEVYGTEGNSNSYSASDIEGLFGASETTFTLTNPDVVDIGSPSGTPYSYLTATSFGTSGDPLLDGIMSGYQISTPGGGDPLVITYSFANPDDSFFIPGYSDTDFEIPANISALTGAEQAAVRNILNNISEDINIIFVEVPDDGEASAGQMRFAWTNGGTEDVEGTSAWAYFPGNYPQASDVWLIEGNLDFDAEIDNTDSVFENIVLHEIGHALGLKHPFEVDGAFGTLPLTHDGNNYTVMSYEMLNIEDGSYDDYALPIDMVWLDILALQYIYGANSDHSGGDNIYTFLPEQWNYLTVWDAGGTDTFDMSNYSIDISVNLVPGEWSDVGIVIDVTNGSGNILYETLHISADTVIENVIGGSGDDSLTGNDYDNIIDGGAGDDEMFGGLGNDTFLFDGNSEINLDLVSGGGGIDTVEFSGDMGAINMATLALSDIEVIDSTDTNFLDLTIDINDVLDITDDSNALIIAGGAGDSVSSSGEGWTQGADEVIDSETYNTYTADGATLLIDEDITQDIS